MFCKTATVACSLAALLMIGCDNGTDDMQEDDVIVTPDENEVSPTDDLSPAPQTPPETQLDPQTPETTDPGLEPTTPDEETEPAPADDAADADEPVVEEVPSDSLPEEEEENE